MIASDYRLVSSGGDTGSRAAPPEGRTNRTDGPSSLMERSYRADGPPLPRDYAEARPPHLQAARALPTKGPLTESLGRPRSWPRRHE